MSEDTTTTNYLELAADIVSAYVSQNSVQIEDLPNLIGNVHAALRKLGQPGATLEEAKPVPAVSVKKSITPDYLISLEDGKPYKSLKRHLTRLGLTPEDYRAKWGLPRDYPMVAPSYAAKRSELAKSIGLGQQRGKAKTAAADAVVNDNSQPPAKRGRKKAA